MVKEGRVRFGHTLRVEGLIFGAICVAWLIYLVPWFLSHRGQLPLENETIPTGFSRSSMTIVRAGASLSESVAGEATVSTPLTRRAVLREVRQIKRTSAMRRRRLLLGFLLMLVATIVLAALRVLQWAWVAAPGAMIVAFLVLSPISVKALRRRTNRMLDQIDTGGNEETIVVSVVEVKPENDVESVSLAPPVSKGGSLWEPIAVTAPTYMSEPLAARTVRTIDLSSPVAPPRFDVPVPVERVNESDLGDEDAASAGA